MSTATYRSKVIVNVPPNSRMMFIDPGIDGTGWCVMITPEHLAMTMYGEWHSGVIHHTQGDWEFNARCICRAFEGVHKKYAPVRTVFEFPETWHTAKSHAATVAKNGGIGDLYKLACLIGGMKRIVDETPAMAPVFVLPREWKGQLPKSVVITRVAKIIGRVPVNHEADAIGMAIAAVMGKI